MFYYPALSVNNSHAAHVTTDTLGKKDKKDIKAKTILNKHASLKGSL